MDYQVPFKVYLLLNQQDGPEVRRFGVDKSVVTSFDYLKAKLEDVFPVLKGKQYKVTWKDEERDDVTILSDDELIIALAEMNDLVKLFISCTIDPSFDFMFTIKPNKTPDGPRDIHANVVCDICDGPVVGYRYKCVVCRDFDLCGSCEAKREHPEHCMIRIPTPKVPMDPLRNALKRLKSVASHSERFQRKHKHDSHGTGEHKSRRHERSSKCPRDSWFDVFANYMHEFTDLAGDLGNVSNNTPRAAPTSAKANATGTQPPPPTPQSAQDAGSQQTTSEGQQASTENPATELPPFAINLENVINQDNMKLVLDALANILSPAEQRTGNAPNKEAEGNVEVGQGDAEKNGNVESGEGSFTTAKSADTPAQPEQTLSREPSIEKVDGWTMINNDNNDLINMPVPAATATVLPEPIGFKNIPQDSSDRRFKLISDVEQAIATSPLIPGSSPRPSTSSAATTTTTTPTAPQAPQTTPIPLSAPHRRLPLRPHIATALEQMMAMGFSNDGGWLSQLLENKDGNIPAVIDLLTPVESKRK